jgi:hypothetical protein
MFSPDDTFLLLLPLFQICWQVPPSARALHYFDESTHDSVQYVTVTLEKKFPPCLVGSARTQAEPKAKTGGELNISLASTSISLK